MKMRDESESESEKNEHYSPSRYSRGYGKDADEKGRTELSCSEYMNGVRILPFEW